MRKAYQHAGMSGVAASMFLAGAMLVPSASNTTDVPPDENVCSPAESMTTTNTTRVTCYEHTAPEVEERH